MDWLPLPDLLENIGKLINTFLYLHVFKAAPVHHVHIL